MFSQSPSVPAPTRAGFQFAGFALSTAYLIGALIRDIWRERPVVTSGLFLGAMSLLLAAMILPLLLWRQ